MSGPLEALWNVAPTRMRLELALNLIVEILKIAEAHRIQVTLDDGRYEIVLDDLADALAETQQDAEKALGDRVWNLRPDVLYSQDPQQYIREQILHDDGCYALILGRVFDYLFRQDCLEFDHNTKSGYRLKDGKKIILRGS